MNSIKFGQWLSGENCENHSFRQRQNHVLSPRALWARLMSVWQYRRFYLATGLLFALCFSQPTLAPSVWAAGTNSITSPDTAGDVGRNAALVLDRNGYPVIAYADETNGKLKVMHCNDANCSGGDESITSPTVEGLEPSLALDANGYPVISYTDLDTYRFMLLHCNDVNCAGNNESITELVNRNAWESSLVLDRNGYPVISYFDSNARRLGLIHCSDANCANTISVSNPDNTGDAGQYTSLKLDANGYPVISYIEDGQFYGNYHGYLRVIHCNDANCVGGGESIVTVDDSGYLDWQTSLALDANGYPVVSYFDSNNDLLKVLHCNDVNCAGNNESITMPDPNRGAGYYSSLVLDSQGYPVISYFVNDDNDSLRVMHCNDANCAGNNESVKRPDTVVGNQNYQPIYGSRTMLVLDSSGYPVVSYFDLGNFDLKLLHCANATCEADGTPPTLTVSFPAPNGQNNWYTSSSVIGSVTATDASNIASIYCSNANVSHLTGIGTPSASATLTLNWEGTTIVTCRATDGVGNTANADGSQYTVIRIDATAPDTTITAQPTTPSNSRTASFSFSGSDTGNSGLAGFQCSLDGGSFTACTSPASYNNLADGSHTFQVRAVDYAGTVDASPASSTWTIDATAPTVTINQAAGQADPTKSGPLHFVVVFSEAVTGFDGSDVDLSASTAPGTLVATVTGSGTTYDVAVSGMTNSGTVLAKIPANAASDAAGNGNQASTSTDNSVSFLVETLINNSVTQVSVTAGAHDPTLTACGSAGSFATQTLTLLMHNNTSTTFSGLFFKIKTLDYKVAQPGNVQPKLCNADVPGGDVGVILTVPGSLTGDSNLSQAFVIGLPVRATYRIFVDLYSTSATAATADDAAQNQTYLGSFEYEFDPNGQLVGGPTQLFLPLINR